MQCDCGRCTLRYGRTLEFDEVRYADKNRLAVDHISCVNAVKNQRKRLNLTEGWIADANSVINIESHNSNTDGITTIEGSHVTLAGAMNLINGFGPGQDVDVGLLCTVQLPS